VEGFNPMIEFDIEHEGNDLNASVNDLVNVSNGLALPSPSQMGLYPARLVVSNKTKFNVIRMSREAFDKIGEHWRTLEFNRMVEARIKATESRLENVENNVKQNSNHIKRATSRKMFYYWITFFLR